MDITYLGHSSFLLKFKSAKVICDPFDKSVGFSLPKTTADIVTISHDHKDHNNIEAVSGEPMVINGPGEYEIKGVVVTGLTTFHDENQGKDRGKNTVYVFNADDLRICHLGDLGHELNEKQLNELDGVDILMIPVGGDTSIEIKKAIALVKKIGPSIVVPMHYKTKEHSSLFKTKAKLSEFVDQLGIEPRKEKKLKIKKLDLPEELQLVVLERYAK
ncbi:MAG: MBL fold metallo-hydrolase [Patescibacteria group bacterium]|nr:MBL fold metallo-hydrolase [Patescibacteria group bacterium]